MKNSLIFFIIAVLYFFLSVVVEVLFGLQPDAVRLSVFMSPLAGIFYGNIGALGVSIGNVLVDLFNGYYTPELFYIDVIPGAIGNFLAAWVPYKIWNSKYLTYKDIDPDTIIINIKGILKVVASIWLGYFLCFSVICIGTNIIGVDVSSFTYFYKVLWYNADYAMVLDIPIIVIWSHKILFQRYSKEEIRSLCSMEKPLYYKISIFASLAIILVMLLDSVYVIYSYSTTENLFNSTTWDSMSEDFNFLANIMFALFLFVLYMTEKYFLKPIRIITQNINTISQLDYSKKIEDNALEKIRTDDELELLGNTMNEMVHTISDNVLKLQAVTAKNESIKSELQMANKMQQSLLPTQQKIDSIIKNVDIHVFMKPAREVGGDLYDARILDDDHLMIIVADVSGKGVPAAMFMTVACAFLRYESKSDITAGEIMSLTNEALAINNPENMFVTTFLGIYQKSTNHFQYVNAGHTKPVIVRSDGTAEYLKKKSGPMLGAVEGINYKTHECTLGTDDVILLYTDGVTEAENAEHEFFGNERLMTIAENLKTREERRDIISIVNDQILEFTKGAPQSDDITMLSMYIK